MRCMERGSKRLAYKKKLTTYKSLTVPKVSDQYSNQQTSPNLTVDGSHSLPDSEQSA